jgi:hypothetical protein
MLSGKRTLQILASLAALLMAAPLISCTGFFQNPTLTGITVGPTATITTGNTVQMTATGTFNDGSSRTLSGSVFWSSGTGSVATVSAAGLVTGVSAGTSLITGSYQTQSNTATITVQLSNILKITLTPLNSSIASGTTQQFDAMATTSSGTQDITDSAIWTSSNSAAGTIDSTNGFFTANTVTSATTTVITATAGNVSASTNLTVNP